MKADKTTKGPKWKFERSSGFPGWRCDTCRHWIYMSELKECDCTKKDKKMAKPKNSVKKRLMSVHHSHKYGDSVHLILASKVPTEKQLIKGLGIDFEPDLNEFIEVHEYDEDEIVEFP